MAPLLVERHRKSVPLNAANIDCCDVRRSRLVVLAMLMTGCMTVPSGLMARFVPPATDQFARAFIDTLQHAPAEASKAFLVPELAVNDAVVDSIRALQRVMPSGRPDSLQIVNVHVLNRWNGSKRRTIDYQMHASGKWAVIELVLEEADVGAEPRVAELHVWALAASLQTLNAFTLQRSTASGLIAALLALLILAISVYAAVQVVRSPLKRRWLWVIIALIGFGKFGVSWNTGSVTQQWMAVELFGAGIARFGLYGQWWIFLSMPGGAILALDRRRRALAGQAEARAALAAVAIPPRQPAAPEADSSTG